MNAPRTTRRTVAPAYYLGRPAAAWQIALRRRQQPQLMADTAAAPTATMMNVTGNLPVE